MLILSVFWVTTVAAYAQTTTGVIDGVIRDSSGQSVPGVQVVANSPALIQRDLTVYSNQQGYYRLPALPPGTYTVTFELQGFTTIQRTGLIVATGQTTSVDIELTLAALRESVTVVGQSPTVDPTSAKMGFTYTQSLVENVPTKLEFSKTMYAIPGVESGVNSSAGGSPAGSIDYENVLGAGKYGNWYKFDGANVTNLSIGSNQTQLFSYGIIDEVQVLTGGKPAEVGFAYGGFFQIVTKSGGNDFHGEGSDYYQNEKLESNNIDASLLSRGAATADRIINASQPSVSMGGRFVRDKLWWFGSAQRRDQTLALTGLPFNTNDAVNSYFWKNTYQPTPQHTFTGLVSYWQEETNPWIGFGTPGRLVADDKVGLDNRTGGRTALARWKAVLTSTLLVDAGVAFGKEEADYHEVGGVAVQDLVTGVLCCGRISGSMNWPMSNWHYNGSLSWFVPDAAGRHDFKFGADYTHGFGNDMQSQIGDQRLFLASGKPSQVQLSDTPTELPVDQYRGSMYAQDAWTIRNRLTLNLGVRYDHTSASLQARQSGGGQFAGTYLGNLYPVIQQHIDPALHLLTWNKVAPRLAASWSIDDRTAVRASYSRYYHSLNAIQLPTGGMTNLTFRWNDLNSDGKYELGEEGQLLSQTGGIGTSVDPNISQPFSDEIIVGISRELSTDFSFSANFVHRDDKNLVDTINTGIPFGTYTPVQFTDPGNAGQPLTVYAQSPATFGRNVLLFTNPDLYGLQDDREYRGIELILNKRLSHRWQFVGTLVAARMEVTVPTDAFSGTGTFLTPNSLINARGRDTQTQPYQVKLLGTYQAPFGFALSGSYRWSSGLPYTRQLVVTGLPQGAIVVFAEPRGSRLTDTVSLLDFRVEKTLNLYNRTRVGLILDVFNLNNASTVTGYGSRTGIDLGLPSFVHTPRTARLGVRFTW